MALAMVEDRAAGRFPMASRNHSLLQAAMQQRPPDVDKDSSREVGTVGTMDTAQDPDLDRRVLREHRSAGALNSFLVHTSDDEDGDQSAVSVYDTVMFNDMSNLTCLCQHPIELPEYVSNRTVVLNA